jgi:HSP20 family molecular chaperone IbpA
MGLVSEVIKEIGNKSREFYEFVLPPIDMYHNEDNLKVVIDIPGFNKDDIKLILCEDILSIKAQKEVDEKESETLISNQRPNILLIKKSDCQLTSNKVKKKSNQQNMKMAFLH